MDGLLVSYLAFWLVCDGWLVGWLFGLLLGWLAGWLLGQPFGKFVQRMAG
jgi:hypothetical protein